MAGPPKDPLMTNTGDQYLEYQWFSNRYFPFNHIQNHCEYQFFYVVHCKVCYIIIVMYDFLFRILHTTYDIVNFIEATECR